MIETPFPPVDSTDKGTFAFAEGYSPSIRAFSTPDGGVALDITKADILDRETILKYVIGFIKERGYAVANLNGYTPIIRLTQRDNSAIISDSETLFAIIKEAFTHKKEGVLNEAMVYTPPNPEKSRWAEVVPARGAAGHTAAHTDTRAITFTPHGLTKILTDSLQEGGVDSTAVERLVLQIMAKVTREGRAVA